MAAARALHGVQAASFPFPGFTHSQLAYDQLQQWVKVSC